MPWVESAHSETRLVVKAQGSWKWERRARRVEYRLWKTQDDRIIWRLWRVVADDVNGGNLRRNENKTQPSLHNVELKVSDLELLLILSKQ